MECLGYFQCCNGNALDHAQKKKNVPQLKPLFTPVKYALATVGLIGGKVVQQKRHCFHPGSSNLGRVGIGFKDAAPVTPTQMLTSMFHYIWPKVRSLIIRLFLKSDMIFLLFQSVYQIMFQCINLLTCIYEFNKNLHINKWVTKHFQVI